MQRSWSALVGKAEAWATSPNGAALLSLSRCTPFLTGLLICVDMRAPATAADDRLSPELSSDHCCVAVFSAAAQLMLKLTMGSYVGPEMKSPVARTAGKPSGTSSQNAFPGCRYATSRDCHADQFP